jgi:predicted transcriptional regulator
MKIYSDDEFRDMLKERIKRLGTQSAFAAKVGVSTAFLHDVLNGRRRPSDKIISELGLTEIRGFAKQ